MERIIMKDFDVHELNMEDYYSEYAATLTEVPEIRYSYSMYDYTKRFFDIVCSLIGIVVGSPIMIVFSVLILLETPGSPIYRQKRVGLNGRVFTLYKVRSMYNDAEKNGAKWADKEDCRVTKIGSFIRKTRIDELPQLFNILKGDMSLIGPRPERPNFTVEFNEEIPGFVERLKIKPGLTGWAQVNGGYDVTPGEKLELDVYYIEKRNLWIDLKILWKTVGVILTGEGAR